jgi:hypothetical protein
MSLSAPNFWKVAIPKEGLLQTDGSFQYVLIDFSYKLTPLIRSKTELFSAFIKRECASMKVAINGSYYGLTTSGKVSAALGSSGVAPSETTIEGQVVVGGKSVAGLSRPNHFYFAQLRRPTTTNIAWTYSSGKGDPPTGTEVMAAVGGLGPMIIGGLEFGPENQYKPGTFGPRTGEPPKFLKPLMIQRSNATFADAESRPAATGKTIIAACTVYQKLLIGVQPHGQGAGQSYGYIAEALLKQGFDNSVFLDGSDSTTFMLDGKLLVAPGANKDETTNLALGFTK